MSLFDGMSRPMRLAGVALVAVALVAAVVGTTVALTSGDSGENAAPASTPPSESPGGVPGPGSPSGPPPPTTPPSSTTPPPSSTPGQPGGPPAPGRPGGVPGQPGGEQAANKWVTVRVYNNSMIHGLAAGAAEDFRQQGWNVAEVTNYPYGIISNTTAYFRPGTDEETAAKALASAFGLRAEPRFEGIQQSNPGVIVIVTNDYKAGGKNK